MWEYKMVFWNEDDQRIRWTQTTTFDNAYTFQYVGRMTEPEFDLLLECLFALHEDDRITIEQFEQTFNEIRQFCNKIKKITEEI